MGISFAFWASSIQGDTDTGVGTLSIGSWNMIPEGYIGVSQDGLGELITLNEIGFGNNSLSGNYILVSNINWNNGAFTPIGGANGIFSGTFLGNGYVISNINITTSQAYVGLFARNSGTISGVSLTGLTLNVATAVNTFAGGIAGENTGVITKSYVTGTLSTTVTIEAAVSPAFHYVYAGGIAGTNTGTGSITDSHASVNVNALVSVNTQGGNKQSNAISFAGGLVGRNTVVDGVVRTYANGTVTSRATATANGNSTGNATAYAGGLVGHSTVNGGVKYGFATGNVTFVTSGKTTNTRFVGGLNGLGDALSSYRLTGQTVTSATNTIGTAATEAELKSQAFVTNNLLFSTDVWSFDGINYPRIIGNSY
jgi:hypothetical protein